MDNYYSTQSGIFNFQVSSISVPSLVICLAVAMGVLLPCHFRQKCRLLGRSHARQTSALSSVARSLRTAQPLMAPAQSLMAPAQPLMAPALPLMPPTAPPPPRFIYQAPLQDSFLYHLLYSIINQFSSPVLQFKVDRYHRNNFI